MHENQPVKALFTTWYTIITFHLLITIAVIQRLDTVAFIYAKSATDFLTLHLQL